MMKTIKILAVLYATLHLTGAMALSTQRNNQVKEPSTDQSRQTSVKTIAPPGAVITIDVSKSKRISDCLFGIFFEDINYAADGGL